MAASRRRDNSLDNPYLPHNFVSNPLVYTGTHDNAPTRGWYEELPDYQRQNLWNYVNNEGSPPATKKVRIIEQFVTCQTTVTTPPDDCVYRRFQVFAIV